MVNNRAVRVQTVAVPETAPKVDTGLVVRTIIYIVAIVNAIAAMLGYDFNLNVDENFIYEGVTILFTLGGFASAYWKNNNVTKEARIKDATAKQVVPRP